jgi:hypothetical protein
MNIRSCSHVSRMRTMRFLLKIVIPAIAGNDAIRTGQMLPMVQIMMKELKPESSYFGIMGGERTFFMVVDIPSADKLPWTLERFWMGLHAEVFISPVMNYADFEKAIKEFEKLQKA